jgi:hypothetical protein
MQIAKRNDIIRVLIILTAVFTIAIIFFGSRIFLHRDYVIAWPNESSLIFKSWYLITGLGLLVIHFFSFLREWYHRFKRELMNLVGLIISVFLLTYCVIAYFGIDELQQHIKTTDNKLLSLQGVRIDAIDYSFLFKIRIALLVLITWSVFTIIFLCIKLLPILRRKNEHKKV